MRVGGLVLCGGQSRRMGSDKTWLRFGKEFLLPHMVGLVENVAAPVVVASRPGQSLPPLPPNTEVALDEVEDAGPLAGLSAGFRRLGDRCDAILVVACDHPLVSETFLRRLIDELKPSDVAIVPTYNGRNFPLLAMYRPAVRDHLDACLASRSLRVGEFVTACGARLIDGERLGDAPIIRAAFANLNDPDAYRAALRAIGK